jgi:hypothetical protein
MLMQRWAVIKEDMKRNFKLEGKLKFFGKETLSFYFYCMVVVHSTTVMSSPVCVMSSSSGQRRCTVQLY